MQIHLMYLAMSPAEREYLPRSFVLMNKILQKEATKNRKTAEEIFQERGQISGQIIIMHPKSVDFFHNHNGVRSGSVSQESVAGNVAFLLLLFSVNSNPTDGF